MRTRAFEARGDAAQHGVRVAWAARAGRDYTNPILMRRFWRPLLSIFRILTGREPPVDFEVRAPAGLPVETGNLDHANGAVRLRRRRHGLAADQARLVPCLIFWDRLLEHAQVLRDDGIELGLERAQQVGVGVRQIEVDAGRAVGGHLHAGHESAAEALEHERVDDVEVGMQLLHEMAELRVDPAQHPALDLDGLGEGEPGAAAALLEARDRHNAAGPFDAAAIGQLPAAAGIERRAAQQHRAGAGFH